VRFLAVILVPVLSLGIAGAPVCAAAAASAVPAASVPASAAPAASAVTASAVPAASAAAAGLAPAVHAASVARAPVPVAGYRWPLDGVPALVRRFDPPPRPWLAGHRGVDLAAAPGATVRAAGPGTVAFAGTVAGRGVVSVQHADGLRTTYEPVEPSVVAGAAVAAGAAIGVLMAGHAGCPAPACLHWGLRRGETYLDPLMLLGFGRVRLLPLGGAQESG
jgi:murein DD-endopeptidase MepM/ murein hydrolase activator NlpD